MKPLVDPRDGDVEADTSSPERHSLLSLAGGLLAEVSLPKLVLAVLWLIVVPAVLLGAAAPLATIWLETIAAAPVAGAIWAVVVVAPWLVLGWLGGKRLLRIAERSFWALNALAVQPAYAVFREVLLQLLRRVLPSRNGNTRPVAWRAIVAALSGLALCALALWIIKQAWPATQWVGSLSDLASPQRLVLAGIANSVVLMAGYLAVASLLWGIADSAMPQPRDVRRFAARSMSGRVWRVAHLSDIHVVGERYGFRVGSGRMGPRGNDRLLATLTRLDELHRVRALDAILITGDLTDAGTSAEWAELLDAFARYPRLADLIVALPGNHDLNVVDRANPARLDLPMSPSRRLREVRTISALAALQGARLRVVDHDARRLGGTLAEVLQPYAEDLVEFADRGSRRRSRRLADLWASLFPMVQPPATQDGLGIVLLNSNAETHFSFTNALGLVSAEQARALDDLLAAYPRASWIVALHHHLVDFPAPATSLGQRIGTTLINGSWFTRRLQRHARRIVVMHGHRHVDWIGGCGELAIVSAPSTTMKVVREEDESYFYVHTLGVAEDGRLELREPERVTVGGRYSEVVEVHPR